MTEENDAKRWWKYRVNTSAYSGAWRYIFCESETIDELEESLEWLHELGIDTHSEHYRGIKGEVVERPPESILRSDIENALYEAEGALELLGTLVDQLFKGKQKGKEEVNSVS